MREWLVSIRRNLGLSQRSVADQINISPPSYCNIEHGKRKPTIEHAKAIAKVLGFDWTRFYEDDK